MIEIIIGVSLALISLAMTWYCGFVVGKRVQKIKDYNEETGKE